MDSLEEGIPLTIAHILESHNWRRRRQLVDKVFTPDAVFWHPAFVVRGREQILGIYQLWGANNYKIRVTYDRVVPDDRKKTVVVDLLEITKVWWLPTTWVGLPVNIILHTVFEVEQDGNHYIYNYQEDHALFLEALLYSNPYLTFGLPYLLRNYVQPLTGIAAGAAGNWLQKQFGRAARQSPQQKPRVGMLDLPNELSNAMHIIFAGNDDHRIHTMNSVYTDDMTFWHPFMSVQGKESMLGVARLWTFLCGHLEIETRRVVSSMKEDVMLIDLARRFRPRLWPFFFPPLTLWVHVIVHLVDVPGPQGGKLISRHEDHVMWEESLLFGNLGPFSKFHEHHIRPFMGQLFAFIGTLIYHFLKWLDLPWEDKTSTAKQQSKGFVQRVQGYLR